jgi:hypothetical protein
MQGKNLTNTPYAWSLVFHIRQPSVRSLLSWNRVLAPGIKSSLPAIIRPGHHPRLPHSPSTKPCRSREGQFDKAVSKLLGLSGPKKPTCNQYKSKLAHQGQNNVVLNRLRQGLPSWNLVIAKTGSSPFPSKCSMFLYLRCPVTPTNININVYSSHPS